MNGILFEIYDEPVNSMVGGLYRRIPLVERRDIESVIAVVTNADLTTAIRPFAFGGKIVHELYFDTKKLVFFTKREKIGAVVSALIISALAGKSGRGIHENVALSDQTLMTHRKLIVNWAKRWKYGGEVAAFLKRLKTLEDGWRRDYFPDIPDKPERRH